ncbi:hypothetical protein GCM10022228_14910 [Halomonas cibimaris]|uniref:Uncharacterized protein n=1 Tax=Halomonas cibimaris TaxID=657012 RepID=A0ABP7LRQ3_9GAMM
MLRTVLLTLFFAATLTLVGLAQAQTHAPSHTLQAEAMQPVSGTVQ